MGAHSFDDEITQVPSQDGADQYFTPNKYRGKNWGLIFQICFKTLQDNDIIWLQYRVLHRILGTQYTLHKIGKAESSLCLQCNNFPETLRHLFYYCNKSQIIWNELKTLIQNAINFTLNI